MKTDILIIGGGVIGAAIARELSRYEAKTLLIEAREDLARGASGANSGIVHAGYDPEPGTLMAKYNVAGCGMYEELSQKLNFPYKKCGSFVLAFSKEEMAHVQALYERGLTNGVPDMEIISGDRAREMDPALSDQVEGALFAKSAGIVSPYEATIAFAENAAVNGVSFRLAEKVTAIEKRESGFLVTTDKATYEAACVVNAAGRFAGEISAMAGGRDIQITEKKGEYTLYDRNLGGFVSHVMFQCPNENGKGILVTPTAEGNMLLGPNSILLRGEERGDTATTPEGQAQIFREGRKTCPQLPFGGAITGFAGVRASFGSDFIIEADEKVPGLIQVAGICSPGLTSAPAIAVDAALMALKAAGCKEEKKKEWTEEREGIPCVRDMDWEKRAELCQKDAAYGRIVCRCETVTEGQIRKALKSPIPVYTIDGVKRRCRAGMGRCQGSFCTPVVMQIIEEESGIPFDRICKSKEGTAIARGTLKGGAV
ncbi:MAG: FAD-dependent oxidoreductase [Lachnospiraceae bacterium]|nr:FAD-dependent oxidoreductase [Lachnospiraceae bacterium]